MKRRIGISAVIIVLILTSSGCMNQPTTPVVAPKVVITPCNTANTGIQVRIKADKLDNKTSAIIKPELVIVFVDNFKSAASADMLASYALNCYWGSKIGQRRDYYYCDGKYKAPDLDENQIIRRYIWKQFTIGFAIEEHNVGSWTDSSGKVHNEGSIFYLTTKSVTSNCYLAT
jgi:hypothetical protein